ncbi:hypothetical protein C7451_11293 [Blastomonas natatoria]|uniref:Antitoxin FitA-like ribbon-helix-helix domain-containing protein n=1 Tax=Blastomonas natatoria TaxID=34015 RepID=A0A2V3UTE0_9SPHN|nr:hypothetical protein C7451_11293 [Blastomonas natatoria]
MGQVLIRKISDETLKSYRALARERGTSLEAELRDIIEAHRPLIKKPAAQLRQMSEKALALRPPGAPLGSDSTLIVREDRDTQHGKWVDDAGR